MFNDPRILIGLTLAGAGFVGFIFTFFGAKLGKFMVVVGVLLATAAAVVLGCRPLAGSFPAWPTDDALYRGAWTSAPLVVIAVALWFSKVPNWLRAIAAVVCSAGGLFWVLSVYPPPSDIKPVVFYLEWIGIPVGIVLALWLTIEPIAVRTPGAAAPLIVGFLCTGIGALGLMSTTIRPGQLIAAMAAVVGGATLAAMLSKPIQFSRGPVFAWLAVVAILYVPGCYDAETVPWRALLPILGAPPLAWIVEVPFIKRCNPWKRELVRGMLLAGAVAFGLFVGRQMMKQADPYSMLYPQSAAPIFPSQIPMPKTINPPTIT